MKGQMLLLIIAMLSLSACIEDFIGWDWGPGGDVMNMSQDAIQPVAFVNQYSDRVHFARGTEQFDENNRVVSTQYTQETIPAGEECVHVTYSAGKRDHTVYASQSCKICRSTSTWEVTFTGDKIVCPRQT